MSDHRAKNAVYLVSVPESFRPQRPWDLPPEVLGAELYVKNLALTHVLGFVRAFNKRALERGLPDRQWAMAVKHTPFRWRENRQPERNISREIVAQEGGR